MIQRRGLMKPEPDPRVSGFSYTGNAQWRNWKTNQPCNYDDAYASLALLTSGKLTILRRLGICDMFVVGGGGNGGNGCYSGKNENNGGNGGGGGYVQTVSSLNFAMGQEIDVIIGDVTVNNGTTQAVSGGTTIASAACGDYGRPTATGNYGYDAPNYTPRSSGNAKGEYRPNFQGSIGYEAAEQLDTTRAFGESDGFRYAVGGAAGVFLGSSARPTRVQNTGNGGTGGNFYRSGSSYYSYWVDNKGYGASGIVLIRWIRLL